MYAEARIISLIEKLLKIKNEATLKAIETVLDNTNIESKKQEISIYDFVGILSKKEASEMRTAIEETCETITPDDWK